MSKDEVTVDKMIRRLESVVHMGEIPKIEHDHAIKFFQRLGEKHPAKAVAMIEAIEKIAGTGVGGHELAFLIESIADFSYPDSRSKNPESIKYYGEAALELKVGGYNAQFICDYVHALAFQIIHPLHDEKLKAATTTVAQDHDKYSKIPASKIVAAFKHKWAEQDRAAARAKPETGLADPDHGHGVERNSTLWSGATI